MAGRRTSAGVGRRSAVGRSLGPAFGRLWAAYAVSAFGTRLAFDAFAMIAVLVLHAGPGRVALLAAAGTAVGAVLAVPLGPWVEFRYKRPVMIGMDLVRAAALLTLPLALAFGLLTFGHLLVVAVVVAAADIAFGAAAGAYLKALVPPEDLLTANARFESTSWTATMVGPPLGGAAVALLGPMATVLADAVSYLLSALGIRAVPGKEPAPAPAPLGGLGPGDLLDGWRHILGHPVLRPLLLNNALVNGLIMAGMPLLAVLMLGPLGFAPWAYALAFAAPCLGGLLGSRLARPLVARYGPHRVLRVAGILRVCWSVPLAFVGPGAAGLALVMVSELALITCSAVFAPVLATRRLELTGPGRTARTLAAWSVTGKAVTAAVTALWGLLAAAVGIRPALALAGVLLLATPALLPRREGEGEGERERESVLG
ncbi:MFS transporter [Streptomyces sp. NPDC004610]|uniref:MFS transporter n=1 Tax=unclassified Streptomyces TaxID=2593676 RepID=UPI00339F979C